MRFSKINPFGAKSHLSSRTPKLQPRITVQVRSQRTTILSNHCTMLFDAWG